METKKKQDEVMVFQPVDNGVETLSLEQAVNIAEHNIEIFRRIKNTVLKATHVHDWVKMGNNYQITGAGSERIAALIGVNWSETNQNKTYSEDETGKYYIYEYRAKFNFGKRVIEAIGTCSQRDKFFSVKGKQILPTSEIDETNVMKAAYTNMVMNGVSRILGIRGITSDDLTTAGFKLDDIAEVNYRESGEDSDSEAQKRKDIREYLISKHNGNKKEASEELIKLTEFKGRDGNMVAGKNNIEALSAKQIDILYGKLKDAMLEFNRTKKTEPTIPDKTPPATSEKLNPTQIKWIEDTAKKQNTDIAGLLYEYDFRKPLADITQADYKSLFEAITKKG